MPRIEENQLIANVGLDPERINLIRHFYSQFDYLPAGVGNRHIVNVEPLFYQGAIAGTEFLVYDATKLYLFYSIIGERLTSGVGYPSLTFYDENNVIFGYTGNLSAYWDATAAAVRNMSIDTIKKNNYFSRLVQSVYSYINFNGYRITLD